MPLAAPITPHLWLDTQARDAAAFYCATFADARIDYTVTLRDTPSGDCEVVGFRVHGQPFQAISAGPLCAFNPSVSFFVNFDPSRDAHARAHLDAAWAALAEGGRVLMPLDAYPFSPRYGWVQDRFGLSWQLILTDPTGDPRPVIVPSLLFAGEACGQAEDAGAFYRTVFDGSRAGQWVPYPEGMAPDRANTTMYSDFLLDTTWFAAMDSARSHDAVFNEAISFVVHCRDQAQIDRYWAQLSSVPQAERCGWCKDRFGVSWQVVPWRLEEVMRSGDAAAQARATRALLPMRKLDLAAIEAAVRGDA